jgi:iron complex outermembrane receptor protein
MMKKSLYLASSAVGLAWLVPVAADAQTAAAQDDPNEIVVTAQHRSETIQKVPMSITALSGEALVEQGAKGFDDYLRQVPGVSFVPQGPGLGQLNIRGVQTQPIARDQPGVKPSVGIYLDEMPIAIGVFNPDLDIYDMSRVEVLRGPQGTLFGSGSLAGTIRFITNKPDPEKFEGSAELSASGMTGGSANYDAKAMVNVPVSDTVALRVVGYENHYGGFIDQVPVLFGGNSYGIDKKNVNSADKWGVRAQLGIVTDKLKTYITYVHQKIDANGYPLNDTIHPNIPAVYYTPPINVPVSVGLDQQFRLVPEARSDRIDLVNATIDYDLGAASLVSVSSYSRRKLYDQRDYSSQQIGRDRVTANYAAPAYLLDSQTVAAFSQELRLVSSDRTPLTWSVGAFYSDVSRRYNQAVYQPGLDAHLGISSVDQGSSGPDRPYDALVQVKTQEYAVYGEAKYALTDQLSITGGIRGFKYEEINDSASRGIFGARGGRVVSRSSNASGISPRGIISYKVTPDVMLSAQVSRGFRPGSSNDILPAICAQTAPSQYEPETLTNYELSAKTRWLNGAVTFNAAAYEIKYDKLQLNARLACSFSFVTNGSSARTRGVELELALRPIRTLNIGLNATFQDPKLTSDLPAVAAAVLPGVGEGSRLPGSPKYTFNGSFDYVVPNLLNEWSGYLGGNVQVVGGIKTYIQDPDTLDTSSYTLASARIGIRNDTLDVGLFIDNIANERAELSLERESRGRFSLVRNTPRTFGIRANAKF